ncbi:MAG TPA: hypothetical protein VKV40_10135 [Ktedonobacteraceae bacterium]|nr:hypothetical protein [Ktedonobacteraceae bacterium]
MANVIHMPSPSTGGGKKQRKKLVKQEAKLMLKVEQARKDVQKAQGKVAKAQAQLDNRQKRLQAVEEKLAAFRASDQERQTGTNGSQQPEQSAQQETSSATMTGTAEQNEPTQPTQQGEQGQQLPVGEIYVDGAVDTERARTPGEARSDVLQEEGQELSQEHAVAADMAQAQDQSEVSVPSDNQEQNQHVGAEEGSSQTDQAETPSSEQQAPVSSHSQSYLQAGDDETTTGETESYGSTQY